MLYGMVSFLVTLSDPDLVFKVAVVFDRIDLENGAIFGRSYYWTLIGSRTWGSHRYHFRWPWTITNPDLKGTLVLKGEYLENGAIFDYRCYGTLIESHMLSIEWCAFRWPWVTPSLGFHGEKLMLIIGSLLHHRRLVQARVCPLKGSN